MRNFLIIVIAFCALVTALYTLSHTTSDLCRNPSPDRRC
jgi:hypothetical protein